MCILDLWLIARAIDVLDEVYNGTESRYGVVLLRRPIHACMQGNCDDIAATLQVQGRNSESNQVYLGNTKSREEEETIGVNKQSSQLALRSCRVQRPAALHRLQGLFLDARQQLRTGGDIMDQSDDLTGCPHLHKRCTLARDSWKSYFVGNGARWNR